MMAVQMELVIRGGSDKKNRLEKVQDVCIPTGEVVALVGTTGSGKSRLLSDIERLTQGDSPTGRSVSLIGDNGGEGREYEKIGRISQSMGFILDATVEEFLTMHASFKGCTNIPVKLAETMDWANRICGEMFTEEVPLAHLSGGQARALMIADTVIISNCQVLLIDEIENAGIDKRLAMDFLLDHGLVTIIATHDPLIALKASKRIIMHHGGMIKFLERTADEQKLVSHLVAKEDYMDHLRQQLREGMELKA